MFWSETERWREQVIYRKPVLRAPAQPSYQLFRFWLFSGQDTEDLQEDWLPTTFCRVEGPGRRTSAALSCYRCFTSNLMPGTEVPHVIGSLWSSGFFLSSQSDRSCMQPRRRPPQPPSPVRTEVTPSTPTRSRRMRARSAFQTQQSARGPHRPRQHQTFMGASLHY